MNEFSLRLITLFSPVLSDETFSSFTRAIFSDDSAVVADGAKAVAYRLYETGLPSAADYLRVLLLDNDNPFARAAAQNKDVTTLLPRAEQELRALGELIVTPCSQLKNKIPKEAQPLFPQWNSGVFTLSARELADEYRKNGYGAVRSASAFTLDAANGAFKAVLRPGSVRLCDLKEYREEKRCALQNTRAFLAGKPASNILFYGDRGTGKSATVHALLNEFSAQGLKLLQAEKADIRRLTQIKEKLAQFPNLHFIVFFDDLSFDDEDETFSLFKSALEGDLGAADNIVIYATTNRRHLIKENTARGADAVHASDLIQEQLSLFDRFGLVITYIAPEKREYLSILEQILSDRGIAYNRETVFAAAERYALKKGGRSPRAAKQFADMVACGPTDSV